MYPYSSKTLGMLVIQLVTHNNLLGSFRDLFRRLSRCFALALVAVKPIKVLPVRADAFRRYRGSSRWPRSSARPRTCWAAAWGTCRTRRRRSHA